jgi:hypothetical protein
LRTLRTCTYCAQHFEESITFESEIGILCSLTLLTDEQM